MTDSGKQWFVVVILISSAALFTTESRAQNQPNVIFIMTDDVGYGDLGVYGATDVQTPNLDALAGQGVRFTDFYANAPNCTPTRAGFMTGRYQQRYGIEEPISPGEPGLDANGRTLPQLLKDSGYRTGLVGKWHLGFEANELPGAHGFDYFFGFRSGFLDYYQHIYSDGEPDLWENDRAVTEDGYLTDLITEHAIDFIEDNVGRQFFLSVQYNAAHWPYQPPDRPSVARDNADHLQPYMEDTSTREDYIAILERADQGIGEIIEAVDRAGLGKNTIIIFTNDNGGEWLSRNQPFFQRKSSVWEGGIRVPTLIRWPGVVPEGTVSHQVGITMDITATILAATKTEMPDDLEGIDLMPVITGQTPAFPRTLYWRTRGTQRAVRSGDWKLITQYGGYSELNFVFNLQQDIGERNDLAWSPQGQAVARRLRALLDAWEADVSEDAEALCLVTQGCDVSGAATQNSDRVD